MNYQKVYAAFIESRNRKSVKGYFEIHHVKPRAFGGKDTADNLIKLSPEDHFFAHLLLAKIYGGRMVGALFLMSNRRWSGRPARWLRSSYGFMRREWVKFASTVPGLKGKENANYNHDREEWLNLDTLETRHATLHEMFLEFGGVRGMWTQVKTGAKNSAFGWVLATRSQNKRGMKGRSFDFININGESFTGTQQEFCAYANVSIATASRICRHGVISVDGWMLEGAVKPPPARLNAGGVFKITKDGVSLLLKRRQAAEHFGCTVNQFSSAACYATQNSASYRGWLIEKTD